MAARRKPISFDTTLRNPSRIPKFVSVLNKFEGKIIDDNIALELEAEIICQKIFIPSEDTLGTYIKSYDKKFSFTADDQSVQAKEKVECYYNEWKNSAVGKFPRAKMVYLLKNTITEHKEKNWKGGWESRIHTQFNFLNELGFVRVVKGQKIQISPNGKKLIESYDLGHPKEDDFNEASEQTAFLNAFAKYQINNPYRKNTIKVNFFPLVLKVIQYLKTKYNKNGISKQDLPFIICWGDNNYIELSEYIYNFRIQFGYRTSDEVVYDYAMNLLNENTPNSVIAPASQEFKNSKKNDYKFTKIMSETPDEVIRKLRLTMLISLRGAGNYIDINENEHDKVAHILKTYTDNKKFDDDFDKYFKYMGTTDLSLAFSASAIETVSAINAK